MSLLWRRLAVAVALVLSAGAGAASAQTVVIRNAPAGASIELWWNETSVGTAKAAANGEATLSFASFPTDLSQVDAAVHVDTCDALYHVRLVQRGLQPPAPPSGCRRTEIGQYVLLQPSTSLLVDMGAAEPTVWVRQGPVPPEWMADLEAADVERPRRPAPTGLVLFADGGYTNFSNTVDNACGAGTFECEGKGFRPGYRAGAALWLSQYIGFEAAYVKPSDVTASGSGPNYSFETSLETQLVTASGLIGIPAGPVRFYGRGGINHHRGTMVTLQTFEPRTIVIDGVETPIEGGTQQLELATSGVGWLFGGGLEGWINRTIAIYGDISYAALKGGARDDGEGEMDERITSLRLGLRIRLGR